MNLSRRKLFLPSTTERVLVAERRAMSPLARSMSDRRAVAHSLSQAQAARIYADQQTQSYAANQRRCSHKVHDRLRLSRRTFLGTVAATVVTTAAYASTPFTTFAFPGTGQPTSRTMPARIADIFNVLDYGATGNGSTDDTAAINAAVTAASNNGTIFFPKGTYKVTSAILIATGSSLQFIGEGNGSTVSGSFNGFIFDNLSTPYNAAGAPSSITNLNIQNGYAGNCFTVTATTSWSAGSSITITLNGSNPGVAVGGALWTTDSRISTNTVFVGMITSMSWPNVTLATAAIGSGSAGTTCGLKVIQCYAANGSWVGGATTITMSSTPPAGISGQYYVFDYEYTLADPLFHVKFGVATWSGTTLTFTPGTSAIGASIGSADRLWLAPVAGGIRASSMVGFVAENCFITGFQGITSSEDKIVANDPTLGGAEGFHITVDTCTFSNPAGCQAALGQVGVYLQNNSQIRNINASGLWCAVRFSGAATALFGGRMEVNYFGVILGGDVTASNNSASDVSLSTFSLESNLLGIYVASAGLANISAVGILCNAVSPIAGIWIASMNGVIQNTGAVGNFGTGYAIYIADPGNGRGQLSLISVTATNQSTPAQGWRLPILAWWGSLDEKTCNNPALVYTFANRPKNTPNVSPAPFTGETYDFSDINVATFLATAGGSGSGVAAGRRARFSTYLAITSITRSSTTATVTTTTNHGLSGTFELTIQGADQTDYNGSFTCTTTGANTFTYTVANSPTTPATGTITYGYWQVVG